MSLTPRIRFAVLQRDGFTCRYCGARPPAVRLQVDHIVPRARGGSDDPENLLTACRTCNQGKAARPVDGIETEDGATDLQILSVEFARIVYFLSVAGLIYDEGYREDARQEMTRWIRAAIWALGTHGDLTGDGISESDLWSSLRIFNEKQTPTGGAN